jgi:hypothetical protein
MSKTEECFVTESDVKHAKNFTFLIGKKVESIRYVTQEEARDWGWDKRPLIIEFTDQTCIIPQSDDEGNDGGALYYIGVPGEVKHIEYSNQTVIYVI